MVQCNFGTKIKEKMSYHFILEYDVQSGVFFVEKSNYTPKDLSKRHTFGERLTGITPQISVQYDPRRGVLTDLLHEQLFLIVSEKVKDLFFKVAPLEIEIFPVEIKSKIKVEKSYYFINIPDLIPGIDYQLSDMDFFPDTDVPEKVRKLVLNEEAIGGRHLFRLRRLRTPIFISKELKEAILANGFTGFKFDDVESFTDGVWQ
jgi:hypothetical protein